MKQIGKYGNSDPHFVDDWITVAQDKKVLMSAEIIDGACSFPSNAILRIFHEKIGKTDNYQSIIKKADLVWKRENNQNEWKYTKPNPTQKQRFQISVGVQYYSVPQETTLFIPASPLRLPLPRNVLYPFAVYGSTGESSSA